MNLITNTAARAAIVALIEAAPIKTRKTTKGAAPARGCLMHRSASVVVADDGEFEDRDGAVFCMGGLASVQVHRADEREPFGVDLIRFYGAHGLLDHEEALNTDNGRWFSDQAKRAMRA